MKKNTTEKKVGYPSVVRELMTAIESMRMACEHAEGKTKRDKERLSHAMSIGITVNAKHAGLLPDYQKESFWDDVRKQKG